MNRSWPQGPATVYNSSIIAAGEVTLAAQVSNEVTAFAAAEYGYNTVVLSSVTSFMVWVKCFTCASEGGVHW